MAKEVFSTILGKFPREQQKIILATIESAESLYPYAERTIAWGMPTLKIGEDYLCHVMAFKKHNSFFPSSGAITAQLKDDLADYVVSKGTIQFPLDKPLPKTLMKKILVARLEMINDSYPKKNGLYIEYSKQGKIKKYIKNIKKEK